MTDRETWEKQVALWQISRKKARARWLSRQRQRGYEDNDDFPTPALPESPSNQPPVAADDFFEGEKNATVLGNCILNDVDAESDELTATLLSGPSNGELTGGLADSGDFTYTPDTDFVGSDSFTYEITDGFNTDTGTVFIEVLDPAVETPPPTPSGFTLVSDNTELANAIAAGTTKIALAKSGSPYTIATNQTPIANLHITSQFQDDPAQWSMLRFFTASFVPAPYELIFDRMRLNGTFWTWDPHAGAGAIQPLLAYYDCQVSGGLALFQRLPGTILEPTTRKLQNLHIKRVTASTPSGGRQFATYYGIQQHIEIEDVTVNNYFRGGIDLGNEQGSGGGQAGYHDENLDTYLRRVTIDTIRHNPSAAANWCIRLRTTNTLLEDITCKNLGTGSWAGAPNAGPEHDTEGLYTKVRKNGGPTGLGIDEGNGTRWGLVARRILLENCGGEQGMLAVKGSNSDASHNMLEDVTMRAINGHHTAKIWLQCLGPTQFRRVGVTAPPMDGSDEKGLNLVCNLHNSSLTTYGLHRFINCSSITGPRQIAGVPGGKTIEGDTNWIIGAGTEPDVPAPPPEPPAPEYDEDAAATTLFAAMSTQPTQERKVLYNDAIVALKAAGYWDSLDFLYFIAAHDSQAAKLNIKSPAANTITLTSDPVFVIDQGYATDGVDDVLDLNFNPATAGGNFAQNSASFGIWSRTSEITSASRAGWFDGTDGITLQPRAGSNVVGFRINQASQSSTGNNANNNATGLYVCNRSAAGATQLYKNGAALSVTVNANQASTALNSHSLQLGSIQAASFAATQFAAVFGGASFDATAQDGIYDIIAAYLQGVGAA